MKAATSLLPYTFLTGPCSTELDQIETLAYAALATLSSSLFLGYWQTLLAPCCSALWSLPKQISEYIVLPLKAATLQHARSSSAAMHVSIWQVPFTTVSLFYGTESPFEYLKVTTPRNGVGMGKTLLHDHSYKQLLTRHHSST